MARPLQKRLVSKYSQHDLALSTMHRCDELQRMTSPYPEMMAMKTCAKVAGAAKTSAIIANLDVPHKVIMEVEEMPQHWLNRYSAKALRYPLFDSMSLLTFVRGMPLVVPAEELGLICYCRIGTSRFSLEDLFSCVWPDQIEFVPYTPMPDHFVLHSEPLTVYLYASP